MKKNNKKYPLMIFIIAIGVVLIIFSIFTFTNYENKNYKNNGNAPEGSPVEKITIKEPVANSGATSTKIEGSQVERVNIKAYLNLKSGCEGGGNEVKNLLDNLVQEYPGRVSVEYIDFGTRYGYNQMVKDGLNCQGLIINGKQTYIINESNGKEREVTFTHPLNVEYTADDLKIVVKSLLGEDRG